jgi:hypothetical protein
MSRNLFVEKEKTNIVTPPRYKAQEKIHSRLRQQNKAIDSSLLQKKQEWSLHPPESMTLFLTCECGVVPAGLVINVCQRIGAILLSRRLAHIYASDGVTADVVLTGAYEDVAAGLGL